MAGCLAWPGLAAGLPKLKIEECAARQQAHIDSNKQARCPLRSTGDTWSPQLQALPVCLPAGVTVSVLHCPTSYSPPAVPCRAPRWPALQFIVGVNKYAQNEEEGGSGGGDGSQAHELDVRKIDNTAVLRTQKERLQVRGAAGPCIALVLFPGHSNLPVAGAGRSADRPVCGCGSGRVATPCRPRCGR